MKKQILAIALGLVLLITAGTAALAADEGGQWEVSYAGGKQLESDYTLSGLADKVFQMQPGDEIELTANLSNKDSLSSNWYMTNKVLETLEQAAHTPAGGAYTYRLTYQGPGDAEELELYNSQRVGGESTQTRALADNRIGLQQATQGLEEWLYLDTLGSGQSGVVRLHVALDGESQGNTYQDTLARLQLNFAVDPVTEYSRTETRTDTRTQQRELRIVRTGDINQALPFIILAGVSGLLLLILGLMGLAEKKRLKKAAQKLSCLALAGFLALSMPAAFGLTAHAANAGADADAQDPAAGGTAQSTSGLRSYTVRLYPGLQTAAAKGATITVTWTDSKGAQHVDEYPASEPVVCSGVCGGSDIYFNLNDPADGSGTKYYLRGVRESGEDNSTLNMGAFKVDRDVDYVIAYGIKGQRVQYALRFVDAAGNRLMDDIVYWGNVGDKPIVACQYIEGYRPNALNLTKTLVEEANLEANIFEFVYTPLGTNVTTELVDGGVAFVDGGVTVVEGGGGGGGGAPAGPGGPAAPAGPGGEELPEPETPLGPPEELVDLDEQKTPLAGLIDDFATNLSGLSVPVKVALIGGAIALGTLLILAIFKKRKKQDAAESEA